MLSISTFYTILTPPEATLQVLSGITDKLTIYEILEH